jgi:hypothetical protein
LIDWYHQIKQKQKQTKTHSLTTMFSRLFTAKKKKHTFSSTNKEVHFFRQTLCDMLTSTNIVGNTTEIYHLQFECDDTNYPNNDWEHRNSTHMFCASSNVAVAIMVGDFMNQTFQTKIPKDWFEVIYNNGSNKPISEIVDEWTFKQYQTIQYTSPGSNEILGIKFICNC